MQGSTKGAREAVRTVSSGNVIDSSIVVCTIAVSKLKELTVLIASTSREVRAMGLPDDLFFASIFTAPFMLERTPASWFGANCNL